MTAVIVITVTLGVVYAMAAIVAMIGGSVDRAFYYGNPFPPFLAFWYDLTYNAKGWTDRNKARHNARGAKK